MRRQVSLRWSWWLLLPLILFLSLILSLSFGAMPLPLSALWKAIVGTSDETARTILLEIRLPRALLAILVGASLGTAGGAFQGVLRNPLADPYLLGVSGGAALGAVTALALGLPFAWALPLAAFIGALGALGMVYLVAHAHRGSTHTLILSGVMIGSLASSLLLFLLWTVPADPMRSVLFWLMGNLGTADTDWLPLGTLFTAAAFFVLWCQAPALDLLTQGEETAADLGLAVGRSRLLLLTAAGALTAMAVALAGLVGFVGLVVPHVVRLLLGPAHRRLLPASALLGASFLLLSDLVARIVLAPAEIPIGVVTAMIGAPFFLYLLRRKEGRG